MGPPVIASGMGWVEAGYSEVVRAREKHPGWRGRTPRRMGMGNVWA